MANIVITNQAKQKIQPLLNSKLFKNSLQRFTQVAKGYIESSNPVPGINLFGTRANIRSKKRMLNRIQKVDDMYIYRDRGIRYIFTIEKDNNNNKTAILLDLMQREEVREIEKLANYRNIKK